MKSIPLVLLLFMALLYLYTRSPAPEWMGFLNAFAEAAMVGALADWFAVTALFRHPMGVPIPHTAIIRHRKDAIGENLANFVADNFMQPDAIRGKLERAGLAKRIAGWLSDEQVRVKIATACLRSLGWLMDAVGEVRLRRFISRVGERHLHELHLAPLAGKALKLLTEKGRHQDLLTQLLRFCIVSLHENRDQIRQRVQEGSPWWMPGFVDDKVVVQMIERIEILLFEMSLDQEHAIRRRFNHYIAEFAEELQTSREFHHLGEQIKKDLVLSEAWHDYFVRLWTDFRAEVAAGIGKPDSRMHAAITRMVTALGAELEADTEMQQLLDEWLIDAIVGITSANRIEISSLISDTVRAWDPETTSRRVELAIGRDLQFIRINGTLVGGMVGLLIHFLEWL